MQVASSISKITAEELISKIPEHIEKLKNTPQDASFHAEGDVWKHSSMVLEAARNIPEFKDLSEAQKNVLEVACVLHDIGKPKCTVIEEDGRITSRNHSFKGSLIARNILWDLGLNGIGMEFREAVCELISLHGMPAHFWKQAEENEQASKRWLQKISLTFPNDLFSIKLLCLLAIADWKGRIGIDTGEGLSSIELMQEMSSELGVYENKLLLEEYSRFKFLRGSSCFPVSGVFNPTWGKVYIMSGLPGTGKSTYIQNNFPNLPIICLDQIRKELNVKPTDDQAPVVEKGFEDAKDLLRRHTSFVWDATCLSKDIRKNLLNMCIDYKAFVEVDYLETNEETKDFRNHHREAVVPDEVIIRMRKRLQPPDYSEAHCVNWIKN